MGHQRIFTGGIPIMDDPRHPPEEDATGAGSLFLLADSQLFFRREEKPRLVDRIAACARRAPRAAYVGASNGDHPDFYSIFLAAMEPVGPSECRMVTAALPADERAFLASADLILLAGGEVDRGWNAFLENGVREIVSARHREGAVLIGVSAGAVQLGTAGWPAGRPDEAFPTWGLAPFVVDAHEEASDWADLRRVVSDRGDGARGVGIPFGAGLALHPDGSAEALRHPLTELRVEGGRLSAALLVPPTPAGEVG